MTWQNIAIFPVTGPAQAGAKDVTTLTEALRTGDAKMVFRPRGSFGLGTPPTFPSYQPAPCIQTTRPIFLLPDEMVTPGGQYVVTGKDRMSPDSQAGCDWGVQPVDGAGPAFIPDFKFARNVLGVVLAVNGELVRADVFANPRLFRNYWPTLIRLYAQQAIERPGRWKRAKPPRVRDAQNFLGDPGPFQIHYTR